MQSNHNLSKRPGIGSNVQSYHNISKNAIESQLKVLSLDLYCCSKLPQHFKECNRITTGRQWLRSESPFKVTTTFQRMQSNHNNSKTKRYDNRVQSYHNISKNAIESQPQLVPLQLLAGSKLPQHFKECNRITTALINHNVRALFKVTTTFQRMQSNHNSPHC